LDFVDLMTGNAALLGGKEALDRGALIAVELAEGVSREIGGGEFFGSVVVAVGAFVGDFFVWIVGIHIIEGRLRLFLVLDPPFMAGYAAGYRFVFALAAQRRQCLAVGVSLRNGTK
jgi:hypothetical protein